MKNLKMINKKPGYFPVKKEELEKIELSDHFRTKYKDYLDKYVFLNGVFVEKKQQDDYYVILIRDTGISKDVNQTDICREHHMWIKCDSEIANTLVKGNSYCFRGKLKPYISNNKLNVGFQMEKVYL